MPIPEGAWPLFLTAHALLTEKMQARLTDAGFPGLDWYDVLWGLESAPDQRLRMSELADHMLISRSNVTRLLDRLEAEGLAARERCDDDRRSAYAVITPAGKKLRKRMWAVLEKAIDDLFSAQLSASELAAIASAMRKLVMAVRG